MRWSHALLLALLTLLPACSIFGSGGPALPPVMPPNFSIGLKVVEATSPPVDYAIKVERTGKVSYVTTVRSPRRHRTEGELELDESQIVRLYNAVIASGFDSLAPEYSASEGAADRRANGERVFYVTAGDVDQRIAVNYARVPGLDALQAAVTDVLPKYVTTGVGGPDSVLDHPAAFVGDKQTKIFHHPDCELCEDIDEADRDTFSNEYDALNFGYHPCEVCHPLETRK